MTLKIGAPIIAPAIAHVINLSLGEGKFPQKWKLARIIPLQKSKTADRLKPSSFRPVSLLPLISKLAERVVQKQILNYLEVSGLLSAKQHAYRNKCSTTTALIELMDTVAMAADENKIAATMSLDQSAAFDCVEHETLKKKLRFYGLDEQTQKWIDSYLTGRSGYVAIGTRESIIKSTPYGVPQGLVMGPLLYLMYINELPMVAEDKSCRQLEHTDKEILFGRDCPKCGTIPIFADDSQYICVSNNRELNQFNIVKNFEKIRGFLNDNGLQINESKTSITEYMTAQKRGRLRGSPPQLQVMERMEDKDAPGNFLLTEKIISDSRSCRTLGMNTQNNLGWESHLISGKNAILPAVRRQLGMLNRMSKILSKKAKLQLANCLILSRLTYRICLWGNSRGLPLRKAQIILNETARFITGKSRIESSKNLMKECGWMNVRQLTEYHSVLQFWKTVNWRIPVYMSERIVIRQDRTVSIALPRLLLTTNSYRVKSAEYWNALPEFLRNETSIAKFKKGVKKWILQRIEPDPGLNVTD